MPLSSPQNLAPELADGVLMNTHAVEGQDLPLTAEALTSPQARATFATLQWYPYYRLVAAKSFEQFGSHYDALIVELNPELPQIKKYDIRYREPLALCFDHTDQRLPRVQALRKDFPLVPHVNLVPTGAPRELCLYAEPPEVVRLTWTPPEFLARIATWFAKTATGTLHAPDQPLEPFLLTSANEVIVPHDGLDLCQQADKRLIAFPIIRDEQPSRYSVRLSWQPVQEALKFPWVFYALVFRLSPREHGLIHDRPRHLHDLTTLLAKESPPFNDWLRAQLRELFSEKPRPRECDWLLLLLAIPQQRESGGSVERTERWAFVVGNSVTEVALAVHACGKSPDGFCVPLLESPGGQTFDPNSLTAISLEPLRVISELTRTDANCLSGVAPHESSRACVLIGAGALGSQIYVTLARMGWGEWTIVDDDMFLPHNSVRHVLGDNCVGMYKAHALQRTADVQLPYNQPRNAIAANAMHFASNPTLACALKDAEVIVDVSTSLAVARALACHAESNARRVSVFLTPSGGASVVMIENADRSYRLDVLEQQYYRAILRDDRLRDHLQGHSETIRYGGSCRDVTTVIAQDDILLHAGLLAKQIRRGVEQDEPQVVVWRSHEDGSVDRIAIPLSPPRMCEGSGWQIRYDDALIERCAELREHKLPHETGGILVGYFDALRKIVYVVDALPAPPDSLEHTTAFIRGVTGLRESLEDIGSRTARLVHYVGEWHSHPMGIGVQMSAQDRHLLQEIADEMRFEGWPGIILIAGDRQQCALYLQTI